MPSTLIRPQLRIQTHVTEEDLVAVMGGDHAEVLSCVAFGWEAGVFGEIWNCQNPKSTYYALATVLFSVRVQCFF